MVKKICEECKGNGFIRITYEEAREEAWADCKACNNQGEIEVEGNGKSGESGSNEKN